MMMVNQEKHFRCLILITCFKFLQNKLNAPVLLATPTESAISFKDVHFEYLPGQNILNGLSFDVPSGKKVAIVGGSGSG